MTGFHGGVENKNGLLPMTSRRVCACRISAICEGSPGQDKRRLIQIEQRVDTTVLASEFYSDGKGCYAVAE